MARSFIRSLWSTKVFSCPRCRESKALQRGPLVSYSSFLPEGQRGLRPLARIMVLCSRCSYMWWSTAKAARALPESPLLCGQKGELVHADQKE